MPARDSHEYTILDVQDEWNVLDSPGLDPQNMKHLPDEEKMELLEKEVERLSRRAAGEFNIRGLANFKKIKECLKIQSGMKDHQVEYCCDILKQAFETRLAANPNSTILNKKDLSDLVTELKVKLDDEYGRHTAQSWRWHCLIGRKMSFHLTSSAYINFYIPSEDMTIVMFRAFQDPK